MEGAMPVFLIPITPVLVVQSPLYYSHNRQIIYSAQPLIRPMSSEECYNSRPSQFSHPAPPAFHSSAPELQVVQQPSVHFTSGLEKRCSSNSSVECAPGRLLHSSSPHPDQSSSCVTAVDRSPFEPTLSALPGPPKVYQSSETAKSDANILPDVDIDALLIQKPVIPPSILARENMRSLEQSLFNSMHGNRKVFICGLHPTTGDDTLAAYASRFGRIKESKAILDVSNGTCKGFGFVNFFDIQCSELCIRGFYKLGYDVSFAKNSSNAALSLYVSELPMEITESEFRAIFVGYKVISCKLLPGTSSSSNRVGFAYFESRKFCDEIIKKFNGRPICEGGHPIRVCYPYTPAQKYLKRVPIVGRTKSAHQLSPPSHPWKKGIDLQRSSSETTKGSLPETSPVDSRIGKVSDSTKVPDDGLGNDDLTYYVDSPMVVCGDLTNSATYTVQGYAKQQQPS